MWPKDVLPMSDPELLDSGFRRNDGPTKEVPCGCSEVSYG